MRILVLNCGSSTLKFELVELSHQAASTSGQTKLARGMVERIGNDAALRLQVGSTTKRQSIPIRNYEEAATTAIQWLQSEPSLRSFDAVGHRVVHGGQQFTASVLIDDGVIDGLQALCEIAPLHNPASVSAIRATRKILGNNIPMVAAFDTSFHRTIPDYAHVYALPHELSIKHAIRRYGFHGLAHQYSVLRYGELTGSQQNSVTAVTMHLGNGCSACAIRDGASVDTSMGFTPLEGLVMGTRSGDLDPALVTYLAKQETVDPEEVENWLNKSSGLLGISGISADMRELTAAYPTNSRARLAIDVFCYRARKYLGAYLAALNGAKAVIFSGGIGENSPLVREKICAKMDWCGVQLDGAANRATSGKEGLISASDSLVSVFVIQTDEEMIIALETARVAGQFISKS